VIESSLAAKRHGALRIKTLLDAPRDPERLREVIQEKQEMEIMTTTTKRTKTTIIATNLKLMMFLVILRE
jgi:hypothetical protein